MNAKIELHAGRTIYIDGAPAFYVSIGTADSYLAPWQADSLARQIAAAMRAGLIRVPRDLEDGRALDAKAAP
jgi:glucose/arabinose dehydrogenase